MSQFPGSPRLLKGALITVGERGTPQVILFQYNPATLTRSLSVPTPGAGAPRLQGAPVESISVELELDATDKLEAQDRETLDKGILPQLAAMETLLYPASADVQLNQALLNVGLIELIPPDAPLVLFVYGVRRVLPVSITSLSITEEAHDTQLNPIRARAAMAMQVLTYNDLSESHPGYALFMAHQITKETMARTARINGLDATGYEGVV
jgi:hypothetical protein